MTTVASGLRAGIGTTIQLDSENIAAWHAGIGDRDIEEQAGNADVAVGLESLLMDKAFDLVSQQVQRRIFRDAAASVQTTCPGVLQEELERRYATTLCALKIDIFVCDRSEDIAAALRSADEYVQPPFSPIRPERPETHGEETILVSSVSDGDENHIALIALDIFQVLDEEGFCRMVRKENFGRWIRTAQRFKVVLNDFALTNGEGSDPERQLRVFKRMANDSFGNGFGFDRIGACGSGLENAIRDREETQPHPPLFAIWAWG